MLEFIRQRRTAHLQRPARIADQGMDRRLHQGNRYQGDLPPGRRHRTGQSAGRRGRGITRRRLPDRELPRHGRGRKGRTLRRPDADTLDQVPAQYRPATGKWTGVAARSTVFVYNKSKLQPDQLPKSMLDLEQPAWKGRWGGAPAKADFQAIVSALLQLKGEQATAQWLAGMKTNAKIYNDNIATMKAVNAGEVDGGIIYHYYWFRDQAKTKEGSGNTALHYFKNQDPGAFVSLSGGGVLKSSKKPSRRSSSSGSSPARPGRRCSRRAPRSSTRWPAACPRIPPCRRSTRCRHPRSTRRRWMPRR